MEEIVTDLHKKTASDSWNRHIDRVIRDPKIEAITEQSAGSFHLHQVASGAPDATVSDAVGPYALQIIRADDLVNPHHGPRGRDTEVVHRRDLAGSPDGRHRDGLTTGIGAFFGRAAEKSAKTLRKTKRCLFKLKME